MAQDEEPSGAQKAFGDFAPALVRFTDDVLFGQVWPRPQLSPKERSLITVAALTAGGNTDQLATTSASPSRTARPRTSSRKRSPTSAFYAGWPKAMSAIAVAKQVFTGDHTP